MERPEYLCQGEAARLFPVLSTTSKEGRTTSIVLACLSKIEEFGAELLGSVGQRVGKRASLGTFTEIVFRGEKLTTGERPDGLIVVSTGKKEWRALIEAKVGNVEINADQVERYRQLGKTHGLDCVITISNQFTTAPTIHPIPEVMKGRGKLPVFHWSWMYIFTTVDLLLRNDTVSDADQKVLLEELHRFLTHESAGIKGFQRMPPEWAELNRLVSAGGRIPARSAEALAVLDAWHQETRDLSLILSRRTETGVHQKLPRKHVADPKERVKDELAHLKDHHQLAVSLDVPDAAAPINIVADLNRRTIDVGMTLRAPEDRKSSKARVNWLLRQIKVEKAHDLFVRLNWPGRSEATQFSVDDLRQDPGICEAGKDGLQVLSFHLFIARRLGPRFVQQANFITDLEDLVPEFYEKVGQNLMPWVKPAPKIRREDPLEEEIETE